MLLSWILRVTTRGIFLGLILATGAVYAQAPEASAVGPDVGVEGPSAREGFVTVDGGRLFYESLGQGESVVLLHDGLLHRETWIYQLPALGEHYQVVCYDRRGYGRSPQPETSFSAVDDLLGVLDQLGIERATLIGCSSGGRLAIDFTLEHPARVRGLVLVGAVVSGIEYSDHFKTRGGRWNPSADVSLEEVLEYWLNDDPYEIAPPNRSAKELAKKLITSNPQNVSPENFEFFLPTGRLAVESLDEIAVPTLILVGEYDIPDVHAQAGAIEAGVSDAKRLVVSGSGHLVHLEVPFTFNEIVLEFLAELE